MKIPYMKYFFTYETTLPGGIGFGTFGIGHWIWLFLITAGIVFGLRGYRYMDDIRQAWMERGVAVSLVVWMALRAIYIALMHENFLYELPLHLCSLTGILCLIHCFMQWEWLGQVLYGLCLPGAVLALVFPNWSFYPAFHFLSIEAFLFHMGIVLYVFMMLHSHKIIPDIHKLWQVIVFMAVVVTPIYFFDKKYDVNYMFVNRPSAGSPLVWLSRLLGDPGYLIGYAGLMVLCVFCMDLGYRIYTKRNRA